MALFPRALIALLCGCTYLLRLGSYCAMLKDHQRRTEAVDDMKEDRDSAAGLLVAHHQDTMTEHMQMLYDKYNRPGFPFKDGNTVRSFKAHWGTVNKKQLQVFNLTSLTKSEAVLSATLHYYIGDIRNATAGCAGSSKRCGHHHQQHHHHQHHQQQHHHQHHHHGPRGHAGRTGHVQMVIWSFASADNKTRTLGHCLVNVSTLYRDFISWQWKDITRVVNQAKRHDELLIGIDVAPEGPKPWRRLLSDRSPYILVYANDSAISEAESVVTTLQRRRSVSSAAAAAGEEEGSEAFAPGFHKLGLRGGAPNNTAAAGALAPQRHKRSSSVNVLLPLQNNELPGPEYPYRPTAGWDEAVGPYEPYESNNNNNNKQARRPRKKTRKSQRHGGKMPLLQFDEQTIKKARKKQWNEPRNCARRYLKVDFADIGWSEWIISPKSFDAYYCSGSCQFPMPKALKPSNHATIQSIVRAVGVVPGIPEPCCVPEKMSSLSILFFDEDKNVVLKVYPNMTVDSCACR